MNNFIFEKCFESILFIIIILYGITLVTNTAFIYYISKSVIIAEIAF